MKNALPLSFFLSFCKEMVPDHGEDSYCHAFCDTAGLVGVFDGCGGAGARRHDYYSGQTEAFMASRLCAGVFYDCFRCSYPSDLTARAFAQERLKPAVEDCLHRFRPPRDGDGLQIRGSMVRTLPSTAAAALIQPGEGDGLQVSAIWAGDSRVYVLNKDGLAQLSADDTSVPDPMQNLYEDGVLKNLLCGDRAVTLHFHTVELKPPFLVFAATDGCFGYLSTPMEFEGLLLDTLMDSDNASQWESRMSDAMGAVAGDDHTLCMAAYGFRDLRAVKRALSPRRAALHESCLDRLASLPMEDRQTRLALWEQYRGQYARYMKDGNS